MGILDDLAMGFGLKERDRDYYERTAATIGKNEGSAASDKYKKYVGMTGGPNGGISTSYTSAYANAPNYFKAIGPSLSDFRPVTTTGAGSDPYDSAGNLRAGYKPGSAAQRYKDVGRPQPGTLPHMLTRSPGILGLLANLLGGYNPIAPQTELPSTYRPQRSAPAAPTTPVAAGAQAAPVQTSPLSTYSGLPAGMEAQYSASPAPLLAAPDMQLEAFTGNPSDPRYMPGGEFDQFMEHTGSLPTFAPYRNDRKKMIEIFEQYLKTQGGGS